MDAKIIAFDTTTEVIYLRIPGYTVQPQSQNKSSCSSRQRHVVCWWRGSCDPHPARTPVAVGPLLSCLQGLRAEHQPEEDGRPGTETEAPPIITIDEYDLDAVHQLTYLGSTITDNLSTQRSTTGLGRQLNSRPPHDSWINPKLKVKTKMAVYNAYVIIIIQVLLATQLSWIDIQ